MKTIIVPVDFSEYSEHALHAAAKLAKKYDAKIIAVHMLELSTVHAYGEATRNDQMEKGLFYIKRAEQEFDKFLNRDYLNGISITPVIRHFKVFSELGEVAEENKADLIVMGSKGSSGLNEFFVGSNTEKVVRYSEIPVLVIKSKPLEWNINRVVFATDFSEETSDAFLKLTNLLKPLNAELRLLNVNEPGDGFKDTDEMEKNVESFLMSAEGSLNRLKDVYYISSRSAEKGILKYANKVNADMIAIVTHGRTGLAHFFEGSISEDLANHGNFPILTLKIK